MADVPEPELQRLEALPDDAILSNQEAATYTGYSKSGLLLRRKNGLGPDPMEKKNPLGDTFYVKSALTPYRKPKLMRRHAYVVLNGLITGHGVLGDPQTDIATIDEFLGMDWADTALMREALLIMESEQQEALEAFQDEQRSALEQAHLRLAEHENKELMSALGGHQSH
ncbi:hypothetical protein [Pseudoxanthomonas mexicana]